MAVSVLSVDLPSEVVALKQEPGWQEHGHNSTTLARRTDQRLVLTVLQKGKRLHEHQALESITIQTITGKLEIRTPRETVELSGGQLLALQAGIPHRVEALEESALLVTFGCPGRAGSGGMS